MPLSKLRFTLAFLCSAAWERIQTINPRTKGALSAIITFENINKKNIGRGNTKVVCIAL